MAIERRLKGHVMRFLFVLMLNKQMYIFKLVFFLDSTLVEATFQNKPQDRAALQT